LNLNFIWHMHQPDYRDANGIMQMPWVFLHAIKDYYDMPWMLARHSTLKATFNITSPIIKQLKMYYNNPQESDRFLALWLSNPTFLEEEDRRWLVKICKSTQYETMVKPFPKYAQLYNQEHFNNIDLVDLEILFMLSWCGVYLRTNNLVVKYLIKKQSNYSHEDKHTLLNELSSFVSGIFDYYAKLYHEGIISISTTPLNHPILPLLIDMNNAKIANQNTNIPKDYVSLKDDAILQVQYAKELFKDTFGFEADGFWPAEGGVDEKSVKLLQSFGIKWIATDEEILFKSLKSDNKSAIYSSYNYNGMYIAFRDHYLSDLIGFTYRHQDAKSASEHFIGELEKIEHTNENSNVFVILDGENAWEFFPNNGFDFFDALYNNLKDCLWCEMKRMDSVKTLPSKELKYLAPGSWINGSFDTWVGNSEKTRAWELIFLTKRDYEHHKNSLDEKVKSKIVDNFLEAECSDWFWWYGDDHFTEFGVEFDELFRNHLINIYDLIKITPPSDLFIPIIKDKSGGDFWLKPQSNITPPINGKRGSFFEWIGCGVVDESKVFSTMDRKRGPIQKIYYGKDDEKIYFAFEGNVEKFCLNDEILIIIDPINVRGRVTFNENKAILGDLKVDVVCDSLLEISIDKTRIDVNEISIRFELEKDKSVIQTLPSFGELKIDLGNDYSQNWFI